MLYCYKVSEVNNSFHMYIHFKYTMVNNFLSCVCHLSALKYKSFSNNHSESTFRQSFKEKVWKTVYQVYRILVFEPKTYFLLT